MATITEHQTLELHNLFTFRGLIAKEEIPEIEKELEQAINLAGAKRESCTIKAVHGLLYGKYDIELIIPINKKIEDTEKFTYKETIKILNALMAKCKGNPADVDTTLLELEKYIAVNKLLPTSVAYQVVTSMDEADTDNSEMVIYIGVSANIL